MIRHFDPVAMVFDKKRHVLDYQLCPAPVAENILEEASALAVKIAEALKLEGILAVEMFVTPEGRVLVNELAPRPHNSGHHSIEACITSQFEQHLRAILDLPLGDTAVTSDSVMINLLGNPVLENGITGMQPLLAMSDVHMHWYGKQYRPARKLGHITVRDRSMELALDKAEKVRNFLNSNNE
jgi:5-(carboxyamino)imidazole ribonucleotide synthase